MIDEARRRRLNDVAQDRLIAGLKASIRGLAGTRADATAMHAVGIWQKAGVVCWTCSGAPIHLRLVGRPARCFYCAEIVGQP